MIEVQATETIETATLEQDQVDASNDVNVEDQAQPESADVNEEGASNENEQSDLDDVEFPKKAVNALNRKDKKINKLRAQLRELEEKLDQQTNISQERKTVTPDEFDTYGEYLKAEMKAELEQQLGQTAAQQQQAQLNAQKEQLMQQRDNEIAVQTQEVSKYVPDLKETMQQHIHTLDALPQSIADIFYNIDNAPIAAYVLAKEGKLETLAYTSPHVAAYEIMAAQNKGMELLNKSASQSNHVSQAPQPMKAVRGTGSHKKQLSPDDDVLKSLGLKK